MTADDARLKLYLAHRSQLISYAAPIVGCSARAEDVVQDAYLRFAPASARAHQPVAYLYRVVRNLALDLKRSLQSELRRYATQAELSDPEPAAASPEEYAYFRDELRAAEAALAQLPPKVRVAFKLHRLEGMTFEQIGIQLGVSTATAARWAKDAFTHISEVMADA